MYVTPLRTTTTGFTLHKYVVNIDNLMLPSLRYFEHTIDSYFKYHNVSSKHVMQSSPPPPNLTVRRLCKVLWKLSTVRNLCITTFYHEIIAHAYVWQVPNSSWFTCTDLSSSLHITNFYCHHRPLSRYYPAADTLNGGLKMKLIILLTCSYFFTADCKVLQHASRTVENHT